MSESAASQITKRDIDKLVTGATPQFSQQIAERVRAAIKDLSTSDPVREYGELQLVVLDRIAHGTTRGTGALGVPAENDDAWNEMPSHPKGGIAPGFKTSAH